MSKMPAAIPVLLGCWASLAWAAEPNRPSAATQTATQSTTATSASATEVKTGEIPPDVLKAVEEALKKPPSSGYRFKALDAAIGDWVKQAPEAAIEWALNQPTENGRRHDMPLTVVTLWLKNDAAAAVAYITNRHGDCMGTLAACWGGVDPNAAAAWVAKQPKEKWPAVFSALAEGWSRKDPNAAAEWASQLPSEQACYTYFMIAGGLAWQNPPAAAAWVAKLPEGDAKNIAAARVANVWGRKIPADLDKIKDWVNQLSIPEAKKAEILKQFDKSPEKK